MLQTQNDATFDLMLYTFNMHSQIKLVFYLLEDRYIRHIMIDLVFLVGHIFRDLLVTFRLEVWIEINCVIWWLMFKKPDLLGILVTVSTTYIKELRVTYTSIPMSSSNIFGTSNHDNRLEVHWYHFTNSHILWLIAVINMRCSGKHLQYKIIYSQIQA